MFSIDIVQEKSILYLLQYNGNFYNNKIAVWKVVVIDLLSIASSQHPASNQQ